MVWGSFLTYFWGPGTYYLRWAIWIPRRAQNGFLGSITSYGSTWTLSAVGGIGRSRCRCMKVQWPHVCNLRNLWYLYLGAVGRIAKEASNVGKRQGKTNLRRGSNDLNIQAFVGPNHHTDNSVWSLLPPYFSDYLDPQ